MLEFLKKHPFLSAVGIFVIGVILVMLFFSGDDGATIVTQPTEDPGAVAANTALSIAQLESQTQIAGINAGLQTGLAEIAALRETAQKESERQAAADALNAQVALAGIEAQKATQTLMSTLSAQVQQAAIDAQKEMAAIQAQTAAQMQQSNNATAQALAAIQASAQATMGAQYGDLIKAITSAKTAESIGLAQLEYQNTQAQAAAAEAARRAEIQRQIDRQKQQNQNTKNQIEKARAAGNWDLVNSLHNTLSAGQKMLDTFRARL